MTHLFYSYISKEKHEGLLGKFLYSFPVDYQHRIMKYRRWEDAQLSILGRLLLRYGLKLYNFTDSEEIEYNEYNKPFLKNTELKFNISHSGDIVVCAITDACDIGVDIELIENIDVADFKFQMTENEWERVMTSSNSKSEFYNYWTQKEATLKAQGMGLSIPLLSFEVTDNSSEIRNEQFYLEEVVIEENYKCHVAFKGDDRQLHLPLNKKVFV